MSKSSIREFKCPTCNEVFILKEDGSDEVEIKEFEDTIYSHASFCAIAKVLNKIDAI
jgi:hypothetical protein